MSIFERIDEIRASLKFQYENEKIIYNELVELYEEAYKQTNKVIYLIDLCRVEKMMFSRTTNKAKSISKQAFLNHPTEKTMYFYLATHVVNGNYEVCNQNLNDAFIKISDKNLLAIKKLYEGGLYALKGDFYRYNKLISQAKDEYQGKLYWQLDSVITQFDLGQNEEDFLGKKIHLEFPQIEVDVINYIFSISADYVYFINYFGYLYESFVKTNPNGMIHLSLVNCSDEKTSILQLLSDKPNVMVNFFDFSEKYDHRPLSAVMRLLVIEPLLEKFNKPVFFGEIDGVILGDLNKVINELESTNAAQLVRVIGSYLPWQRYTCGFGLYSTSDEAKQAVRLLSAYIKGGFNQREKHWWMDQVALEASIRFSLLMDYKYEYFAPQMDYINQFVYTPVGADAHEKKIFYLQAKLVEVINNTK